MSEFERDYLSAAASYYGAEPLTRFEYVRAIVCSLFAVKQ